MTIPAIQITEQPESLLPIVNAAELLKAPVTPRDWHVPNLIPSNTVTLLGGDGSTGKSLVALQLAVATALGAQWLNFPVQAGRVLYVSAEDDLKECHRRLVDILRACGGGRVPNNLTVASLAGKDAVLAAGSRTGQIQPTMLWRELQEALDCLRPRLLILDNLADVFGGEENSRPQARQFVGLLRGESIKHEMAVVVLSHPSLSGLNSGAGTSGSTAWNNSVRSRLYMERVLVDGVESDPDVRRLSIKKANYSRSGEGITLRWKDWVFIREDGASTCPAALGAASVAIEAERVFLDLLGRYKAEGRDVSAMPSINYAPTIFARDARARGMKRVALVAAMNRLFDTGKIRSAEYGPPSKRRKRIELSDAKMDDGDG